MQLAGITDELDGAGCVRFINKPFSELGAERLEPEFPKSRF